MSYTPWTIDEDVQLLEELDNGVKLAEIAISHHRSEGAITSRCRHIAAELYRKGATVNELVRLCRLTERGVVLVLRNRGLINTPEEPELDPNGVERKDFEEIFNKRLANINESLKNVGFIPQNKWDLGKYREMYDNGVKDAEKRLAAHKLQVDACRLRGIDEDVIHRSFSHMHIQLLEQVIRAKKTLAMMDSGSVVELTRQKIAILEELAAN